MQSQEHEEFSEEKDINESCNCTDETTTTTTTTREGVQKSGKWNRGKWSEDEHQRYVRAIEDYEVQENLFNKESKWTFIQAAVRTRSVQQCRSHHQKFQIKLKNQEAVFQQRQAQQQHQQQLVYSSLPYPQQQHQQQLVYSSLPYPPFYPPHVLVPPQIPHYATLATQTLHGSFSPIYYSQTPPPPSPQPHGYYPLSWPPN